MQYKGLTWCTVITMYLSLFEKEVDVVTQWPKSYCQWRLSDSYDEDQEASVCSIRKPAIESLWWISEVWLSEEIP